MANTPVCTVDATGVHRPDFATVLAYYVNGYQGIYGSDIQVGSNDQDGEFLGLLGQGRDDANASMVMAYNAYSPATAQGTGLSSNVKINGLKRFIPSNSTVPVSIAGVAFTTLSNILANDPSGNSWNLPGPYTIPSTGALTVTATCLTPGAILLDSGVQLTIVNPTLGLQSITTAAKATSGAPTELDAQLRIRQGRSTALPSSTMLDGIEAAVLAVPAVITAATKVYQNDGNVPDANGIPGHSIAVVVQGGDASAIAKAIAGSKFACGTYGTTSETIVDAIGVSHVINFFFLSQPPVTWAITLAPGPTFSTNTIALIQESVAAWTNANGTGQDILLTRAYQAAYLGPSIASVASQMQSALATGDTVTAASLAQQLVTLNATAQTYEITSLKVARDGDTPAAADVIFAFNESAFIAVNSDGSLVSPSSVVVTI